MASKTKLLLVDGNSVAFRAFFALYNQLDRFTNQMACTPTPFMRLTTCSRLF